MVFLQKQLTFEGFFFKDRGLPMTQLTFDASDAIPGLPPSSRRSGRFRSSDPAKRIETKRNKDEKVFFEQ